MTHSTFYLFDALVANWSSQVRNLSGMVWKAMRVGAALKAVSMVAGASVLRPYLLFSASIAATRRVRLCSSSVPSNRFKRVQSVGHQAVQMHADEIWVLEFFARRAGFP